MFRHPGRARRADFSGDRLSGKDAQRYFDSEQAAVAAWSRIFRGLSARVEYAALIYAANIGGDIKYYAGRTYAGMGNHGRIRANVVIPFLYMFFLQAIFERIKRGASVVAFTHTHPRPRTGYTCRSHSREDLFLLKFRRIKAVYVIPYENTEINRAEKSGRGSV